MIKCSAIIAFLLMLIISFTILFGDKWKRLGKIRDRIPSLFHSLIYTYISFVLLLLYVIVSLQLDSNKPLTAVLSPIILFLFWWIIEKSYEIFFGKKNLGILTSYDKSFIIYLSLLAVSVVGIDLWISTTEDYSIVIFTALGLLIGSLFSLEPLLDESKSRIEKIKIIFQAFKITAYSSYHGSCSYCNIFY